MESRLRITESHNWSDLQILNYISKGFPHFYVLSHTLQLAHKLFKDTDLDSDVSEIFHNTWQLDVLNK